MQWSWSSFPCSPLCHIRSLMLEETECRDLVSWAVSRGFSESRPGPPASADPAATPVVTWLRDLRGSHGCVCALPGHSAHQGVSLTSVTRRKRGHLVHSEDKINGVTSHWRASPLHSEPHGSTATGTKYHLQDGCARAGRGPKIHRILHQPPVLYPSDRNLIQAGS